MEAQGDDASGFLELFPSRQLASMKWEMNGGLA